jgi:hypothetical protein
MRFMSMVKSTERMSGPPPKALMEAIDNLAQEAAEDGCVMVQAGGLLPTSNGMRVRLSGGKLTVTDGPDGRGTLRQYPRDAGGRGLTKRDRIYL